MSIPYVVRKKADLSSGERKELWYGVPSKMQRRGGVKNKELAVRMAKTTGFHRGQIEGILSELVESIQDLLSSGHSVTIEGLGTFQTALTSQGCVLCSFEYSFLNVSVYTAFRWKVTPSASG